MKPDGDLVIDILLSLLFDITDVGNDAYGRICFFGVMAFIVIMIILFIAYFFDIFGGLIGTDLDDEEDDDEL